ncbi:hypothetical protein MTO96_002255 [Rhipicephalus appendiculatus]
MVLPEKTEQGPTCASLYVEASPHCLQVERTSQRVVGAFCRGTWMYPHRSVSALLSGTAAGHVPALTIPVAPAVASRSGRYRFTVYRQFVWWSYGKLDQRNRVVIPSCAVHRIRKEFPTRDDHYTGYLDP